MEKQQDKKPEVRLSNKFHVVSDQIDNVGKSGPKMHFVMDQNPIAQISLSEQSEPVAESTVVFNENLSSQNSVRNELPSSKSGEDLGENHQEQLPRVFIAKTNHFVEITQPHDTVHATYESLQIQGENDIEVSPAGGNKTTESSTSGSEELELQTFGKSIEYWLSCIGYAVGFGNVWRFPYLVFKNGGAVFLIPYFLALFTVAIPMYMLEIGYGQLVRCQLINRYSIIHPALWGVGLCQALVCITCNLYYITLMPWSISYLIDSFKSPLPWATTEGQWNQDYFHEEALQRSDSISEPGKIVPRMVLCLFIAYVIIYFSTFKGLKSTSAVNYVTVPLPYIMLTLLLIKGVTLPGASIGLKFLFYPDWSKLGNLKVWEDAIVQIAYSSGISFGPLMLYGSARKPEEKLISSCIWLPLINSASSIYAALTIFSFLGYISHTLDIPLSEISDGGLDLAFIAYPGLLTMLSWSNFWSVLFFIMLITIGVDSIFGAYEFAMLYMYEMFPKLREMYSKEIFCLIMSIVYFLVGLIFTLNSGYWIFELFNFYSAGLTLVFLMIVESVMIAWVFGVDNLEKILTEKTGETFPAYAQAKFMMKFFAPTLMFVILCIGFYNEFKTNQLNLPTWGLVLARSLIFVPLGCCLLGLFFRIKTPSISDIIKK